MPLNEGAGLSLRDGNFLGEFGLNQGEGLAGIQPPPVLELVWESITTNWELLTTNWENLG